MRVADYIVRRCQEAGASKVFLVTGGGAMHLNDAFARNKKFEIICFHHEQAAAMAAEAYFRYSGKFPILNVTTGPGSINALNGVYGAYVDSMAMLVVSGQVKRETYSGSFELPLRQLGDQEVNIISVSRSLVKYGAVLSDPANVRKVLDKALFLSVNGRPGPVWIDIPIDVQSSIIDPETIEGWDGSLVDLVNDPSVTQNTLAELESQLFPDNLRDKASKIVEMLVKSKRPVLFLGNGVRLSGVIKDVQDLALGLRIPVVTGWNAHDLLPNDHICYAGRPGTVGDRPGNFTVQNSDFILVLGCRLNIRQISYNYKNFAPRAWKAIVDVDPVELIKPTLNFDLKVCADLKDFLPIFSNILKEMSPHTIFEDYLNWCRERVRQYPVILPSWTNQKHNINPYVFIKSLIDFLPSDSVIVAGNGSACVMGFQAAQLKEGQRFFTNSGSASMGYDLPAAIGVAIARKGKPVYCLAGDGSLMMNLQELQTVIGYRLPIKIIVVNNKGYSSIKQTQKAYFPDNIFGCEPETGLSLPDFVLVARSFGLQAIKIDNLDFFHSEKVQKLMTNEESVLFDVHVDPNQTFSPKLSSRKLEDGTMISPNLEDMYPFLSREEFLKNIIDK